jgi:hypothetical protein
VIQKFDIKSEHIVDGKKIIVLKEQEQKFKPKKKKSKAKAYFNKIKNSK